MLLAAWLFSKGSPRYREWLLNHRIFGAYISNYVKHRGTTRQVKIRSILILWITLSVSAWAVYPRMWIWILLAAVGIGVTWHLLSLRTVGEDEIRRYKRQRN